MTESTEGDNSLHHALHALKDQISHLENLVQPEVRAVQDAGKALKPAWQRATEGEHRLPVAAAVAAESSAPRATISRLIAFSSHLMSSWTMK